MSSSDVYKSKDWITEKAFIKKDDYKAMYEQSISKPDEVWFELGQRLDWLDSGEIIIELILFISCSIIFIFHILSLFTFYQIKIYFMNHSTKVIHLIHRLDKYFHTMKYGSIKWLKILIYQTNF